MSHDQLIEVAQNTDSAIVRERAQAAIVQLRDDIHDTSPILVAGGLVVLDSGEMELFIACFDADQDLRGLCIREHHLDPNGETSVIEERYPVFAADLVPGLFFKVGFPVRIRKEGDRKDESAWKDFAIACLDALVRRCADTHVLKRESTEPVPEMAMPPIWTSIPEPNRVRVQISAYDRAGHESNPFDIQLHGDPERLTDTTDNPRDR